MGARFSSPLHKLLRSAKKKEEEEDEEVKWLRRKWIFIRLIKPWGFVYEEDEVTREGSASLSPGLSRVGILSFRPHVMLNHQNSKSFCARFRRALCVHFGVSVSRLVTGQRSRRETYGHGSGPLTVLGSPCMHYIGPRQTQLQNIPNVDLIKHRRNVPKNSV